MTWGRGTRGVEKIVAAQRSVARMRQLLSMGYLKTKDSYPALEISSVDPNAMLKIKTYIHNTFFLNFTLKKQRVYREPFKPIPLVRN